MSADLDLLVDFNQLAYVADPPALQAVIKEQFEDFQVDEVLGFQPAGFGEHRFLKVRKQDLSTTEAAGMLADWLGVSSRDVGYSGMKDRRGICTQWFSAPGSIAGELPAPGLITSGLEVLESCRNDRKLKIGSHKANEFRVRLRGVKGERNDLAQRIERVRSQGVPNYFGPQRLGRDLSNVRQAQETFRGFDEKRIGFSMPGKKRGMLLSAARSYLFNLILSRRVAEGTWDRLMEGEVLNLAGTGRFFKARPDEREELTRRMAELDVHPTGLLAGRVDSKDRYLASDRVAELESEVLAECPSLRDGLISQGVMASRRSLRLLPAGLEYAFEEQDSLLLSFSLGAGGYATALLRELVQIQY